MRQNFLQGVVRCNHCRAVILLQHRRAHALDCSARKRKQKLDKITFTRNGNSLYAIACARRVGKELWRQEIHYAHAENAAHARSQFCIEEPNRKRVKIIDVGLAIGWEVNERTGEVVQSVS